jgi:hypothetical protein
VDHGTGAMVRDPQTRKYRRTRLFVMVLGCSRKAARFLTFRFSSRIWAELQEKARKHSVDWVFGIILPLDEVKRRVIIDAFDKCKGSYLMAARLLGIGKTALNVIDVIAKTITNRRASKRRQ